MKIKSLLPVLIKKYGIKKTVVFVTMMACVLSVSISAFSNILINGFLPVSGIVIALIIPLILTPMIGFFFFRTLVQLEMMSVELLKLSTTDELTGAHNRRYYIERLEQELSRARRYGQVFSILMIDIDDFKNINDMHGHPAGDAVLCMLAEVCMHESREVDEFARLGGDEFAFLMPGLSQHGAVEFADRLRELLEKKMLTYQGKDIHITVSIGITTWNPEIEDIEVLMFLSDQALYSAKAGGKNKTILVV